MRILIQLFSLKFLAALLGLVYSVLQVRYFGATRLIEIYFAAQSLIYLVTSLTQSGQLAEVFLPEYHKLNVIKKGLGYTGLNVVLTRMLLWGGIIILIVFWLAPYFIQILVPGFSIDDKELAVLIFRISLPYLFLQLMNSFFITVLNADQNFGKAELLGLTNAIINIIVLVFLYRSLGIWALVTSLLLGKIIEFLFYFFSLYKSGYKLSFLMTLDAFNHKSFFKTMRNTFLYAGATQLYNVVLTASISFLPEGTYAVFKYVQNLSNKIRGVFIQPFITIFFTKYSILIQNAKSAANIFTKNMTSLISVNTILIVGGIIIGNLMIDFIWGGDKFDKNDVDLAYKFLLFNVTAIFVSSMGSIFRKMAVAHGLAKKLYSYWVISQLLSALLAYFLIKNFQVNGLYFILLLNTSLMALVSYIVYSVNNRTTRHSIFRKSFFIFLLLILSASIVKYFEYYGLIRGSIPIIYLYLGMSVLILSLYPLRIVYKEFK